MTKEEFSKYEKMLMPVKLCEEDLFQKRKKEESLKKQEQTHLERIEKHEHNWEQLKLMPEDVQIRLEPVRDEVKALRALVAETKEVEGPPLSSPFACPSESPPVGKEHATSVIDLDMAATPLDTDGDEMEEHGVEDSCF